MEHQLVVMDTDDKLHLVNVKGMIRKKMSIKDEGREKDVWRILDDGEFNDMKRGKAGEETLKRPPHEDQLKKGWWILPASPVSKGRQNVVVGKDLGIRIKKVFRE